MFDVGFAEIFLLGLIGLLVLGPERLPAVARTLGGFMRKARASWASLRTTIEAELAEADIAAPIKEASEELKRIGRELKPELPDFKDMPGFTAEPKKTGPDTKEPASDASIKASLAAEKASLAAGSDASKDSNA